jgi:hypothetical protein
MQWEWRWASKPAGQPWQSIGLGITGLILVTACVYYTVNTLRFLSSAELATGTVTDLVRGDRGGLAPVFQWTDGAGRTYKKTYNKAASPPAFNKGQSVPIYYLANQPHAARMGGFWELWLPSIVLALMGLVFLTASGLVWIYRKQIYGLAGYPELSGSSEAVAKPKR